MTRRHDPANPAQRTARPHHGPTRPSVRLTLFVGVALCLLLGLVAAGDGERFRGPPVVPQDKQLTEAELKAQFVGWFAKLSAWPPSKLPKDPKQRLRIGILGTASPFSDRSTKLLQSLKLSGGRKTEIVLVSDTKTASTCHVLFIPKSVADTDARATFSALTGKPILILDGKVRTGAHVQFHRVDKSIRFWVDTARLKKSGVRVSTRLIKTSRKPEGKR